MRLPSHLEGKPEQRHKPLGWLCAALTMAAASVCAAASSSPPAEAATGEMSFWSVVLRVWDYPVFRVGEKAILVSQAITALVILCFGLWVIRRLRRLVHNRLARYTRVDASAAAAVERLVFYVFFVMFILIALNVLQIPLTLFAFLGGALAIGLGFGAQNILNNFISGLILMFERPIRIGDLVEVDSHYGQVQEIGFRCTRIRRSDGIDMLVPNSSFLEKNVINWTLTDKRVRGNITVGVVYGAPTDEVALQIRQAIEEHERVLDNPQPIITFDDFGDNALIFQAYFWTEVQSAMDLRVIRSDIRFRIDRLFREAGIVIAFPQRDTHLDTAKPLEIRLIPGEDGEREVATDDKQRGGAEKAEGAGSDNRD